MAKGLNLNASGGFLDVALSGPALLTGVGVILGGFARQEILKASRPTFGINPLPGTPQDIARLGLNAGLYLAGSFAIASLSAPLAVAGALGVASIGLADVVDRGWGIITGRRLVTA